MCKRTMGFLISHKNNEKRRALLPKDLSMIKNCDCLYFESGYGESVNCTDEEYLRYGVHVVSREEVLECDIIVDVKLGDADYLEEIEDGKILCGWAHAVQGIEFTSVCLKKNFTVIAWEEIFEHGQYIFHRNREVAGEAGILQAFLYCGKMPYDTKVAILGNGQTAKGALRVLNGLGAEVDVYGRNLENLFKRNMDQYDVLVNCIMWDTNRTDRIIYREDLKRLKKGCMIVDISCDPNLEIETTHATTIDNPVYVVDGIIHYAVDNTPAMFPYTVTKVLSSGFALYVDQILENRLSESINKATVIKEGNIKDINIRKFRERIGEFCK
ncbi:MAG: N(5)-(carboxyethyl)ornithine synthase [Eubacteriales bacterium]|nr:N(5)-(carboxyethyl)ornithine synthase [Eubacteriales bacterium]